jgi:hypothetical protein
MPQIYVMLSPHAQRLLGEKVDEFFEEIDKVVTEQVVSLWQVIPHDVTCSGVYLAYTRNEADVQIELRYTVGNAIYKPGEVFAYGNVFDPSIAEQSELIERVMQGIAPFLAENQIICSMWCKPYANSKFEIP